MPSALEALEESSTSAATCRPDSSERNLQRRGMGNNKATAATSSRSTAPRISPSGAPGARHPQRVPHLARCEPLSLDATPPGRRTSPSPWGSLAALQAPAPSKARTGGSRAARSSPARTRLAPAMSRRQHAGVKDRVRPRWRHQCGQPLHQSLRGNQNRNSTWMWSSWAIQARVLSRIPTPSARSGSTNDGSTITNAIEPPRALSLIHI